MSTRRNWKYPTPLSRKRVRGVVESQFRRLEKKLSIVSTLWRKPSTVPVSKNYVYDLFYALFFLDKMLGQRFIDTVLVLLTKLITIFFKKLGNNNNKHPPPSFQAVLF